MAHNPTGAQAPGKTPGKAEDTGLRRVISRRMLVLFIVGDILGAGIYALTGKVAAEVGGAIWAPFLVAFVLAALTAASYAELVGRYPRAAGAALYANKAFKQPFFTFLVAFAVMSSGITSASAAARAFGGDYLAEFVTLPTVVVGIAFVLVLAAINFRGISESVKVNIVLTLIEATGLVVILAIGLFALVTGDGEPGRAVEFDTDQGIALGVLGGAALAFYALLGFEDSVNLAEEAQEPRRNYPRALFVGLGITGAVYLLVAFVSSMLVDTQTLADSDGPLLEVVKAGGLDFPPKLFALIALLAVTNTALINMIMASRLVYGMANERIVPSALGTVHAGRRTPVIAILFTTALAVILVSTGDLEGLADTTVLLLLLVFAVVNVVVLVLRREPATDEAERGGFRVPTAVPVIGAAASLLLASPLGGHEGAVYLRALILLVLGAVLWLVNRVVVGKVEQVDAATVDG